MTPLLPPHATQPLHGVAASQRIEAAAQAHLPFNTLMQRAGLAVAKLARALAPHARRVWITAGPGNNGGDGFEAAWHLHAWGLEVQISHCGRPEALPPDARAAYERAQQAGIVIRPEDAASAADDSFVLGPQDLVIDALLGLGARRAPDGAMAALVERLHRHTGERLAVDLPSGLNADTGAPLGEVCVRATHTLSLLTIKPGLFTAHGRDHAGRVWFDDLGVTTAERPDAWLTGAPASPSRAHATHKGSFGDVAMVGGAPGMSGAAVLAARAAHAAGAGRVYVQVLDGDPAPRDPLRPELMWRPQWADEPAEVLRATTVACGCGGGQAVHAVLPRLLSHVPRLVLDADALNVIAADASLAQLLRARAGHGHLTVLTPHPLEAARLLGQDTRTVQADRLHAAQSLAQQFECIVVLKGSGSVVAAPGRVPSINPTGTAALASPGTGDVLAGWLAGLWSSQANAPHNNALEAALAATRQAVWTHGLAAERSPDMPLRAADLVERMHALASAAHR